MAESKNGSKWVQWVLTACAGMCVFVVGIHAASPKHDGAVSTETYTAGMDGIEGKIDLIDRKVDRIQGLLEQVIMKDLRSDGRHNR